MMNIIETNLYSISQWFLIPVLLPAIAVILFALWTLGIFLWRAMQQSKGLFLGKPYPKHRRRLTLM